METPQHDKIYEVESMRQGVDYRGKISIRGFTMSVRPVSQYETIKISADVVSIMSKMSPGMKNQLVEHSLVARETLKVASTSDVGKTDFEITDVIMDRMTPDELQFLFKQYVGFTDKVNPCLEKMTKQEIEDIVDYLKKTPEEALDVQLTELTFLQAINLVRYFLTQGERPQDN